MIAYLSKYRSRLQSQQNSAASEPSPHVVGPRPVSQFNPPSGFDPPTLVSSSRANDSFLPSNIHGKQIWYITAPASVPISSLKEVAMEKVVKGRSILSLEGKDYGFVGENGLKSTMSILLRNEDEFKFGECIDLDSSTMILTFSQLQPKSMKF
jgi:hypothetical protein